MNSDWNTPDNWYSSLVPGASDNAYIPDVTNDPVVNEAPATPALCNNLTIDAGAVLTVAPGKSLTVNGTLTNNAGSGGIVIQSDASGTGSLIESSAGVDGTMQRYIPQRTDNVHGWHFLSSPVGSQAIQTEFVPNPPGSGGQAFFSWDELSDLWINTKTLAGTWAGGFEPDFIPGKGYLVNYDVNVTKNFTGMFNAADVAMPGLTKSATIYTGWHLLGNPFSSPLAWHTGWGLTNIAAVAKIWNGSGASYSDINPGDIIPATQGFMIQVNTAPGSVTIPVSARTHSSTAWYKSSGDPVVKLKATDISGQTFQESVVSFNTDATVGYDVDFDSYFLAGYAPQFYSVINGENFSTNVLPYMDISSSIPFSFIKTEGSDYTIETVKTENITSDLYLIDLKENKSQNLKENPVYAFTSVSGDDPARFLLASHALGIDSHNGKYSSIYVYDNVLYVINPGESTLELYNMLGQKMITERTHDEPLYKIQLPLETGNYVVRLSGSQNVKTEKIFVK